MRFSFALLLVLAACWGLSQAADSPKTAPAPVSPLVWSPDNPTHTTVPGEISARFTFAVSNSSSAEAVIVQVKPSCGCTTAEMPSIPWRIPPHGTDKLEAVVDLRDKVASAASPTVYYKDIKIFGQDFTNQINFSVAIPPMTNKMSADETMRLWGQQLASVDHQAVFKNDCVKCHLVPAFGKQGEYLFHTTCGICHEAVNRASVVPDLSKLTAPIDTSYWRTWVTDGKVGTLMPGFASTNGGPLDDEQVRGLVAYLTNAFPRPLKDSPASSAK